jgi:hypothetical protein
MAPFNKHTPRRAPQLHATVAGQQHHIMAPYNKHTPGKAPEGRGSRHSYFAPVPCKPSPATPHLRGAVLCMGGRC